MTRAELTAYLTDTYSTAGEHLFAKYPRFLVFRHNGNRKWFALPMAHAMKLSRYGCQKSPSYR